MESTQLLVGCLAVGKLSNHSLPPFPQSVTSRQSRHPSSRRAGRLRRAALLICTVAVLATQGHKPLHPRGGPSTNLADVLSDQPAWPSACWPPWNGGESERVWAVSVTCPSPA